MRVLSLLLALILLLAGCQPETPAPASPSAVPTTAAVAAASTPTAIALAPTAPLAVTTATPTSTPPTAATPTLPTAASPTPPAPTSTVAAPPSTPTRLPAPSPTLAPTAPSALPRATLVVAAAGRAVEVRAEIAGTEPQREYGLMNRTSLPEGEGMLFIFPAEVLVGFWMENTLVPLSIAFIAGDGTIVGLDDMAPQTRDVHTPSRPFRYALEVPQGFFARHGVKVGDIVRYRDGTQLRALLELPQTATAR